MRGESPSIRFESSRYQNSELLLNFAAEKLFNVVQLSTGAILNVTITNFDGFSTEGMLITKLQNVGNVTSEFGVQVKCTSPISPVEGKAVYLSPQERTTVHFPLYAESLDSESSECSVVLKDAIGQTLSTSSAQFNVTAVEKDYGAQGGAVDGPDDGSEVGDGNSAMSNPSFCGCSHFFSIFCFLLNGCWMNILYAIFAIIAIILGALVLRKFLMRWLWKLWKTEKPRDNDVQRRRPGYFEDPYHGHSVPYL
uniref:Generative cell specific-1/HAP2 domain-containing protein n=1 Tax=Rhodosorus marinus TaxID=101924 RepID=A0A7S0BGV0_9RHOD|mmetsp:Transcript_15000/g.22079  ORF Transcript_15000/g.22079 Transcript_15000/m.22079 type:complete len:252 (+) Transcript_15000:863-1618(+)